MTQLAAETWTDLQAHPPIMIPVGAVEQHGPHLPLGTDIAILEAILKRFEQERPRALVAPMLHFGASGEHQGFPGTLSLGRKVLRDCLIELGRSADQFGPVLFASWHGGNLQSLEGAVEILRGEGRAASAWMPRIAAGDAHAGRFETSLMLAIDPGRVRVDKAKPGATTPLAELMPRLRAEGVKSVSPNGVLGDPAGATAAEGREILKAISEQLIGAWDELTRWARGSVVR